MVVMLAASSDPRANNTLRLSLCYNSASALLRVSSARCSSTSQPRPLAPVRAPPAARASRTATSAPATIANFPRLRSASGMSDVPTAAHDCWITLMTT